jgi:Holliday junction resolvasome RuvABC endonuclease subunit
MLALGLDPSLKSYGFVIYEDKNKIVAKGHEGTIKTHVPVTRYIHFRSLVNELLNRWDVQVVGIESPAYGVGAFSERHFGLMMYSLEAIFDHRKDVILFDPSTLKFMIRAGLNEKVGMVTKYDVQKYVSLDTMNPKLINNDEADAYCIAKFSSRFYKLINGDLDPKHLSSAEMRVFLSRTKKSKLNNLLKVKKTAHLFSENSRFYRFSKVPPGSVDLPSKADINPKLLTFLENQK